MLFGIFLFSRTFKRVENIEDIKIPRKIITTTSLAIFTPASITTKLAK
jgi:hypothetical protein